MQERIHDALRRNAVDEALALAQEWAAQAPDDASAQRSLSAALARAGDPAAALVALDQAILLAPDEAGLHFERAALLLRQRDQERPAWALLALVTVPLLLTLLTPYAGVVLPAVGFSVLALVLAACRGVQLRAGHPVR